VGLRDADLKGIDWTREPQSDRERALRNAILARIESEGGAPYFTAMKLRGLTNDPLFARGAASDLRDAIERLIKRARDERFLRDRVERKRLIALKRPR